MADEITPNTQVTAPVSQNAAMLGTPATPPLNEEPKAPAGTLPQAKEEVAAILESKANADVSKETKDKVAQIATKVNVAAQANEEKKKILEAEKLFQEGIASIRDLIAPSSFEVAYDHIKIDGLFCQTYFVYTYPRYIETNWISPVVNYDVTMDISQFIYPISSEQIMKVLRNKVAQIQSSIRIATEKGNVRDPTLETALEDAEQLRTDLQRGQEKFFQFGIYFTIYAKTIDELRKFSKQLESLLAGKLVLSKRADLQMERGFNSTIPICLDELETQRNMNTSPLSTTFPFISSELTSNDGILYGINRHNESLIIFDRFTLENANSVVFAKSGAGKSYTIKLEILRYLMLGTDVIVIDPENEYRPLCETVGGTYLNVSLNSDRRINPFDLPTPLEGEELKPGDLLRSSVINLTGLMRLMLGEISAQEEGILDKALIDTYSTKGITMDVVDPSTYQIPTMEDFYSILSSMDGASDMAQRISKYVSGTYAGIFNKPTNVTLDSGLMVFSVRDLEDELRPIAMFIILNYIWNRVRSSLKKRILVIDEAWSLMQHDDSAKFLFGLVKRARKYYLGVTTITQDVDDFVKSDYGKPIITNSSMQILLKQSPSSIEPLTKIFNLTEGEKYMLLNSGVGQGLFFAGLKHVAIQVIASFSEDKIVTTNPEELLAQSSVNAEFESSSDEKVEDSASESSEPKVEDAAPAVKSGADLDGATQSKTEPKIDVPVEQKKVDENEVSAGIEPESNVESGSNQEASVEDFQDNSSGVLEMKDQEEVSASQLSEPADSESVELSVEPLTQPAPVVQSESAVRAEAPVQAEPNVETAPTVETAPAVQIEPTVQNIPVVFDENKK